MTGSQTSIPAQANSSVASEDAVINGIEVGRALQTTPTKDFAPRFGFAYDLFGKGQTVLRGGYGIFWNNPLTGTSSQKPSNPPFLLSNSLSTTLLPTLRLSNGIPAPPPVDPNRAPSGTTRSIFDPEFKDGYAQQWNLNVSQQFGRNYALEVSYVGSKGTHLVVKQDINQAPPVVGVNNADVNRPFIKLAPGLRALSQVQSRGYSNHHAMLVKFSNRFSNGLLFVNSYTFGKTIDIVSDTEGGDAERLRLQSRPRGLRFRRQAPVHFKLELRSAIRQRQIDRRRRGQCCGQVHRRMETERDSAAAVGTAVQCSPVGRTCFRPARPIARTESVRASSTIRRSIAGSI